MIIQGHNNGLLPLKSIHKPEAQEAEHAEGTEEVHRKGKHNQAFHQFKSAMQKLKHEDDNSTIEAFSEKLKEAADAVGVDLEPIFNYIAENTAELSGSELLTVGHGALFHNPNIQRHPRMISLWEKAAQWEKGKLDQENSVLLTPTDDADFETKSALADSADTLIEDGSESTLESNDGADAIGKWLETDNFNETADGLSEVLSENISIQADLQEEPSIIDLL